MEKRLYLRAFEYSDLPFINQLRNDDALFQLTCGNKYYISSEHDRKWIEDKIFNNYSQLYFVICQIESNTPIGYTCATNIDYLNRKAEFGGIVIAQEFAGRGYATEAMRYVFNHLFAELGVNMIYSYLLEEHRASFRIMEKFGCKVDGVIRNFVYKQNKFHDVLLATLLKSEYQAARV